MKDALGHGSNGLTETLRARLSHVSILKSDAQAADALKSSTNIPIHAEKIDYARNPLGLSRSEVNADGIPNINTRGGYTPPRQGGQSLVRKLRGAGHDWSSDPIQNLKGVHK